MKRAFITGASSGLGKALSQLLAQRGIPLLLTARNENALQELKNTLSVPTEIYAADLSQPHERKACLAWVLSHAPDLIINNAGMGLYGPALSHSTTEQAALFELNAWATIEITLESARAFLKEKREGTILNVSSAAAFFLYPRHTLYAASKGCVKQFSQGLDYELKPSGIRVLTSCPGLIDTDFSLKASGNSTRKKNTAWMLSPERAAHLIIQQIEQGKSLDIIDWKYKCLIALNALLPKSISMHFLNRTLKVD
jgi:short-subunit dehydrogenase